MKLFKKTNKVFFYSKGRLYFSKQTEKNVFFILTVIMLLMGILSMLKII